MTAQRLLVELHRRDVRAWVDGGKLELEAPPGVLKPAVLDAVRLRKAELVELIQVLPVDASGAPILPPVMLEHPDLDLGDDGLWRRGNFIVPTLGTMPAYRQYCRRKRAELRPISYKSCDDSKGASND